MNSSIAFYRGQYLPLAECQMSLFDYGVMQGVIVGEMVRTFQHQPFHLKEHLQRLQFSLDAIGLKIDSSEKQLTEIVQHLVEQNGKYLPAEHDLGISILVTPGVNPAYAHLQNITTAPATNPTTKQEPTILIYTFALPMSLWAMQTISGQKLTVPSIRQLPENSIDPHIKTRSRLHWYLADKEANKTEAGSRALLLNDEGFITELSTANFFIVKEKTILTPTFDSTLNGISQQMIQKLAMQLNYPFQASQLTLSDILNADEAFSTSTPYCLLPVVSVNGVTIGNSLPGPITTELVTTWSKEVGVDIFQQIQLMAK
ncbi:hypothetical protein MNBD_PLANCTO02-116 [hydrothermal vent metagenome]|uniref:D-amino-acid transaminase n=1 Tax=hydrothermal vent metagenome TaxID=652676 RepID=A0A3B1DIU4_9ZZZZ